MANSLYSNKRALHDYTLVDKLETGIQLLGWEVKSLKNAHFGLKGSYIYMTPEGEMFLRGAQIASWKHGEAQSTSQQGRDRKLLAHKAQVFKFQRYASQPGFTIVPLELYENDKGKIKLEIAVVKGKKLYEKKQTIKERDISRQMRRDIKNL